MIILLKVSYTSVVFHLFTQVLSKNSFYSGGGEGPPPMNEMIGRGTPWTNRQFITGPTRRDKQPSTLTLTPTANLESLINLPPLYVFGLWEETGVPRVNPYRHGENMQSK